MKCRTFFFYILPEVIPETALKNPSVGGNGVGGGFLWNFRFVFPALFSGIVIFVSFDDTLPVLLFFFYTFGVFAQLCLVLFTQKQLFFNVTPGCFFQAFFPFLKNGNGLPHFFFVVADYV